VFVSPTPILHDEKPPGALDATVDRLKNRYGATSVTRAVPLGRDPGISVPLLPDA